MAEIKENILVKADEDMSLSNVETTGYDIKSMIYNIRNQQVMIDSDLAMLYQVETKVFNQAVKRNAARFPENFRFQITKEEYMCLRSQAVTLNESPGRGEHRKYLPYAFTEQGIAMLSAVLRNDIAIQVSIRIMNSFVEMRKYIANTSLLYERINNMEIKQIKYQTETNERFDIIFDYISEHEESGQKIFFEGQIYDAFSLIVSLIKKAEKEIILIDGYVDVATLNLLAKKNMNVSVKVYTQRRTKLTATDVDNFNSQYPSLEVKYTKAFHDRFLIFDQKTAYHVGASIKDAGKKCFAVNLINDMEIIKDILRRLES